MSIKKTAWWRTWWVVGTVSAVLAAATFFVAGNWIIMPLATRGEKTVVPDIYQEDVAVAKRILHTRGLTFVSDSSDYVWDAEVPVNHVVSQVPAPYTEVKKGRRVRVVISRGPQRYPVPALQNLSAIEARLRLEQQGFRRGDVTLKLRTNDDRSDPFVFDQNPPPGALHPHGSRIDLSVSIIPSMPDLTSLGLNEATKILDLMGLHVGSTRYQRSETLLPRTVMSQSVPPGSRVSSGQIINIILSHL